MRSRMIEQRSDGTTRRRGIALITVIVAAMVFSIAAYAVLFMSMGMSNRQSFNEKSVRARYAAEAGIVYAMQKLWKDPPTIAANCFPGTDDVPNFDDDSNPATPDAKIDIILTSDSGNCPPLIPGERMKLQAKVTF